MISGTVFNTIGFNGTTLSIQPTSGKWVNKELIGVDGSGRGIYPAYRDFELKWDFLTPAEFNEIYTFFQAIGQTGTVVATLPQFNATEYQFYNYSGCVLRELQAEEYWQNYISSASLLIVRILT